jgi:alkylation response protein AidB-like acyl-CoA dehydrogenase
LNFDFSDDQKYLGEQARRFLADKCPMSEVRKVLDDPALSHHEALWTGIVEMGWLGAAIAEEHGGLGLGMLELCVIAEELGRALAPVPFASTAYFFTEAVKLAGSEEQKAALLAQISAGEIIGCFALSEGPGAPTPQAIRAQVHDGKLSGCKIPVTDGDIATHAVVVARDGDAGPSLFIVDLSQPWVERKLVETLDPTRGHAEISFDGAAAERLGPAGEGWQLSDRILERAAVLLAFEQIGGGDRAVEMGTEYATERTAFGRQIGSYQAIKHKLADAWIKGQVARSNAYFGAWALNEDAPELPEAAAAARIAASEFFWNASKENIQTHGGMGFTWEVDCHLFYRRSQLLGVQAGAPKLWKEKLVGAIEKKNAA